MKDADAEKLYDLDSYKAYVDAFKGEYLTAKSEAVKGGLSSSEYTALLDWLKEMQAALVEVGGTPLYRVYNPNDGDHYFTTDKDEPSKLVQLGWRAEGAPYKVVAAEIDESGTVTAAKRHHAFGTAIWSAYNPYTGEYLLAEEDVKFFTMQNGSQDVVRVYNPYTTGPAHLYTDADEAAGLTLLGWRLDNDGEPVFTLD